MDIEVSNSDYRDFIEKKKYYIDKTLLIEEILNKTSQVVLITRPRRFGKTLNLSMLYYYFNIKENSEHLFIDKKIKNSIFYEIHLNKYPVIFLTFKDIRGSSFEELYSSFKVVIRKLYLDHSYLLKSTKLSKSDKSLFQQFLDKNTDIGEYKESISTLSYYLYIHYNKKVIILLDEYDSIINSIKNEIYVDALNLLKGLISSSFKGNSYLEKGVITGILKIAKEDLFSGANNIMVRTILHDDFNDKFGFTEQEVDYSFKYLGIVKKNEIKDWYNGYLLGFNNKITIYNPYSIANYLQERNIKNYWVNTGDNNFIKDLLLSSNDDIKIKLNNLLLEESIDVSIEENISINDSNIWSLLLFSGYLTPLSSSNDEYQLALVNREVKSSFISLIKKYFREKVKNSYRVLDAIASENIAFLKEEIERVLLSSVSANDLINENSYHMLLKGIFYSLEDYYLSQSNKESGKGRYDLELEPIDKTKAGYIIEVKHSKRIENLDKLAKDSIIQIKNNKYYTNIKNRGINKIIILGISFHKKDIAIEYDIV